MDIARAQLLLVELGSELLALRRGTFDPAKPDIDIAEAYLAVVNAHLRRARQIDQDYVPGD